MPSSADILDALNVLKEVCKNHNDCTDCPLRYEEHSNVCFLQANSETPSEWELNNVDNWRAFR